MERLTKRDEDGFVMCLVEDCEIESCGWSCSHERELWDKLAEYEDLEEQGLLLKLPCKVGAELYFVGEHANGKREISSITVNSVMDSLSYKDSIGKGLYLTKEEAEKALEEMEG